MVNTDVLKGIRTKKLRLEGNRWLLLRFLWCDRNTYTGDLHRLLGQCGENLLCNLLGVVCLMTQSSRQISCTSPSRVFSRTGVRAQLPHPRCHASRDHLQIVNIDQKRRIARLMSYWGPPLYTNQ